MDCYFDSGRNERGKWHFIIKLKEIVKKCRYKTIINIFLLNLIKYLIEPSKSAHGKLRDYVNSVWNKFDMIVYVVAISAFILRNFYGTFWVRKLKFIPRYTKFVLIYNSKINPVKHL